MNYKYYKISRDKAWQTLIETKINHLPIELNKILDYYGIDIYLIQEDDKQAFIKNKTIFLNQNLIKTRARFTIAHELGHILLKHNNLEHSTHTNIGLEEYQANIFARCLLMPAIVLKEINCITPQDISSICNVSLQSAEYRSKRLKELIQRNKFYTSHLEQQIYNNFKNFIENKKS